MTKKAKANRNQENKQIKKRLGFLRALVLLAVMVFFGFLLGQEMGLLPKASYRAKDFNIETLVSSVDHNSNGKDDYADFLQGAKNDAKNKPRYDGTYLEEGYPPENVGVCSDVIWRAFKQAGYSLRAMVDQDIQNRLEAYARINKPDSNIDFRRVVNLRVFFEAYAIPLTLDPREIDAWQPGDIVFFGNDKHIGIISDKRNKDGIAFVLHNSGQPNREEDYLLRSQITGHYRFDASLVSDEVLKPWGDGVNEE